MSQIEKSKANAAEANAKTAAQKNGMLRKVTYEEIYDLIYECEEEAKIDIGNGEYVLLTDCDWGWGIPWSWGIETNGGFCITLGDCCETCAELLGGSEDYIDTFVFKLNEYIEEQNKKEA